MDSESTTNGRQRAINLAPQDTSVGRSAGERAPRESTRPATNLSVTAGTSALAVLDRLAAEIGPGSFERYFGSHTKVTMQGAMVCVVVPTRFEAEMLERRFGEAMRRAARGHADGVEFRTDRDAFEPTGRAPAPQGIPPRATPIIRPTEAIKYRFESFIIGRSNRLAHAACLRVADDETPVPPIFIHGTCGLGKTHLLRACAARFSEKRPSAIVRVTTGEQFTNEFIQAVRNARVDLFRRMYRRVDLLCIDDVHFFTNKDATQGELLHTLDAIGIEGGRLVMASDEHPKEIAKLSERLVSRFMAGAVVKIELPEPELRGKLVRHIAQRRGLPLDDAAADLVAERSGRSVGSLGGFGGSVREIEGLLNQVDAVARLLPELGGEGGTVGAMLVRKALGLDEAGRAPAGTGPKVRRPLSAETIVGDICRELSVDLNDFMGKGRHKRVVLARSLVSSLSRKLTTMSFPEIARAMGRSNHSTIITAQKRLDRQVAEDTGRPLSAEVAGPYAGCTLREVYEGIMKKVQG